jgi:hypothetical protein
MGPYIMREQVQDILRKNIDLNGASTEVDVAIEEMSELTKELVKHRRGQRNILHIAEEIAHVEIMLEQLKVVFNCHNLVAEQWCQAMDRIADGLIEDGALEG